MREPSGVWKNRIVGQGEEPPDQLLANPANWRIHPEAQQDELAKVLETVGWVQRVIVNRRSGHVVDGHLRVQLAMRRDEETVPVLYVDLSPAEERLVVATLDPLANLAGRDDEKLAALTKEVSAEWAETDLDLEAILGQERRPARGLTHEVHECRCCKRRCRRGCGCYRADGRPRRRAKA